MESTGMTNATQFKGSQTEKNLLTAFAGESQARNRYTFFATRAKSDGFEQIANIFAETAENEKEHAKIFFKLLQGGEAQIIGVFPAGTIADTRSNLAAAAAGENLEWTKIYTDFSQVAQAEGFAEAARVFAQVAKVEKFHEARYRKLIQNIDQSEVFKKPARVKWHCLECGYVFEGTEPPEKCPVCGHPKAKFELLAENY